jgi:hypothetical protein
MDELQLNSATSASARQPNRANLIVAAAVVSVMAVVAAVVIISLRSAYDVSKQATFVGNEFLDRFKVHDFKSAYRLMSPAAQSQSPLSAMRSLSAAAASADGEMLSYGKPQWFVRNDNGQVSVQLVYTVTYRKCQRPVQMVLVESGDGYKVYGFNIQM